MLCGLAVPDEGEVNVAGYDPANNNTRLAFRKRIGVVPENLALLPELTIEEHLQLTGPIYGLDLSASTRDSRSERAAMSASALAKPSRNMRAISSSARP